MFRWGYMVGDAFRHRSAHHARVQVEECAAVAPAVLRKIDTVEAADLLEHDAVFRVRVHGLSPPSVASRAEVRGIVAVDNKAHAAQEPAQHGGPDDQRGTDWPRL